MDVVIVGNSDEYWLFSIQTRNKTLKALKWHPYSPIRRAFIHAFFGREACYYDVQRHMVAFLNCVEAYVNGREHDPHKVHELRDTLLDAEWVPEHGK